MAVLLLKYLRGGGSSPLNITPERGEGQTQERDQWLLGSCVGRSDLPPLLS